MPITDPIPGLPVLAFDFDGVIADSLGLCTAACRTVAADMGWPGRLPDNPFGELEPVTFEALAETCGLDPHAFAAGVAFRFSLVFAARVFHPTLASFAFSCVEV